MTTDPNNVPVLIRRSEDGEVVGVGRMKEIGEVSEQTLDVNSRPAPDLYMPQVISEAEFDTYRAFQFPSWEMTKILWYRTPTNMIFRPVFEPSE